MPCIRSSCQGPESLRVPLCVWCQCCGTARQITSIVVQQHAAVLREKTLTVCDLPSIKLHTNTLKGVVNLEHRRGLNVGLIATTVGGQKYDNILVVLKLKGLYDNGNLNKFRYDLRQAHFHK